MTESVSGALVDLATGLQLSDFTTSSLDRAKLAILDCLACGVAGTRTEVGNSMRAWALEIGGRESATVLGAAARLPAGLAALVNGTQAHALDLDDISVRMIHPSVSLLPVVLALGESRGRPGRDVLAAYVVGFEVLARTCRVLNPEHYARGWHSTGTIGPLGAAMAASRVLELDRTPTLHALAMAASSAGGVRANFGSMVKPLHAGLACQSGVQAAELAEAGVQGDLEPIAGASGFLDVFSSMELAEELLAAFAADAPRELETSGIGLKRFASCGAIHTALDVVLGLRDEHGLDAGEVEHVECVVNGLAPEILVHHEPTTGLEGKFSMEYSVAVALLDGAAGLSQYSDERAADPRLQELLRRVRMVPSDDVPVNMAFFPSVVTVVLRDGRRLEARSDVPIGYPQQALTENQVIAKAKDCCEDLLSSGDVDRLAELVLDLERLTDLDAITTLLRKAVA